MTNPRPPTPPLMRSRKRRFGCRYIQHAGSDIGNAQRFCRIFGHSPILWQTSSFEQLSSTRSIPFRVALSATAGSFPPSAFTDFLSTMTQTDFCEFSHTFQYGLHLKVLTSQISPHKVQ